jgi:carbon storage regulator CsrA
MLVLTGKPGEKFVIVVDDKECVVSLSEVAGRRVRLGFDADPQVAVYRESVYRRMQGGTCERAA